MTIMTLRGLIIVPVFIANLSFAHAKLVEYEFDIDTQTVNFSGKDVEAMTVGGSIPAPTIEATVGDTLRVTFHNKMQVGSSIHWHGVLLPNDQDGVPYLTTQPIRAGESFTYEYPIIHHGTYWYHSHTGLQEQRGLYGALVFRRKGGERVKSGIDKVLVLSDWTDENPHEVLRNLKRDDDHYALKKDSVQSWYKVVAHGWKAIRNRIHGSWIRMGVMDISDVGYDAFLINGARETLVEGVKKGDRLRLRIVNASASSYQFVEFSGGAMTIISADGVDVTPLNVDRLRLAIAETYDVIITIDDEGKSYELRASSEDGTGYASMWFGKGQRVSARTIEKPNPFVMDHSMMGSGHGARHQGGHGTHHHSGHVVGMMTEYQGLKALKKTNYNPTRPLREIELNLTGNMMDYTWSFDNKTFIESDKILIKKGETVRFILNNETMMHHPIHLHGHFFRVLNGKGDYSPLKHTVNIAALKSVTIEFAANEEKDWLFHCHNLYHMKSGMTRVVSYEDNDDVKTTYSENSFENYIAKIGNPWYGFGEIGIASHMVSIDLQAENIKNELFLELDSDYDRLYEVEALYKRRLKNFLGVYIGAKSEREDENEKSDNTALLGVHYMLPLLIESDFRIDSEGDFRFGLAGDMQLTDRLSFAWNWNSDDEYRLELEYEVNYTISLVANTDSDYDVGGGIEIKF